MWNYLFYMAYLKQKSSTEYTGIESYVADKIKNEEIQWFPIFRALCLRNHGREGENQITESLMKIKET